MNAQQFLAEFGHIANAPGGIAHLRQMIYQLAVTGALTPRAGTDEDAGRLLARIGERRQELIRAKQYKRMLELESEPVRPPAGIALPAIWRWTRLLDIGEISPRNEAPDDQLAAFVPMSGIPQLHRAAIVAETKRWGDIKKGYTHFADGDVVLAKITPCFENGKAAIVEGLPGDTGVGAGTTELQVFRPIHVGVLPAYVYLFLRSPLFTVEGLQNMTGTAGQKRVPTDYFATRALPLPPTEEQSRIVAKVDELMGLCDQVEMQQQDRRKLQNALRQSILQALASAQSQHELQMSWERLQANFGRLFSEPVDVSDLRKSVLDLAVSGRLTCGAVPDRSASSLKEEILAASKAAMSTGTAARKKHVNPEELQETVLPSHWDSITLDDAISSIDAGWSPACLPRSRDDESKWGVLKTTSVQTLRFQPHEHKELPASLDPRLQYQINVGDILITRAGPKNRVGICCVVDVAPARLMISDKLIRFHIVDDLIDPNFVALCLSAGEPGRIVERLKSGMAESQMNISQDKLRSVTVPLPPIEEQRRILNKVSTLSRMIDVLEEQLGTSMDVSGKTANAAVAALTGIDIDQDEDTPMKAPQTELIARLRLGRLPDVKVQAPLAAILVRHHGELAAGDLWQRFGGEIDAFYAQLKREVAHGWIAEPEVAHVREKPTAKAAKA
ncbi:MAG: restriction endonuclease subunit S [Pseudomonadota bacterium]